METAIAFILYGPDFKSEFRSEFKVINHFHRRETVEKLLKILENHLKKYCYYCNECEFCDAYTVRHSEMKRMGFWTHNKDIKFWDVYGLLWHKDNVKFTIKTLPNNINM